MYAILVWDHDKFVNKIACNYGLVQALAVILIFCKINTSIHDTATLVVIYLLIFNNSQDALTIHP